MTEIAYAFASGLSQVLLWSTFQKLLLGVFIGFFVGILPGLGGPTTLALMLPFIFKMKAVEAFAFLLGMIAVTNTTGDITSILLGVPGEPTAAATIVDGHPMAKKGEGGRALGAALVSSLIGATFGAFALALAIPIVRPLILTFGSPEFFMLSILGLTFVASLSGGALSKGLLTGGIGLFLATVGLCQISGIQRYTFDQIFLWDGIGLVPITIGFFAIPEVIDLAVGGSSIARERVSKLGDVMGGVKDTLCHWWLVIRCSAIGTYSAIIPGMGAVTGQWLAYAHAVQSSPEKERFGKGAIEGVIAPGAANNSAMGGSLITTIAFGVPASTSMAILLGAFLIHGLVPGPDMLVPEANGGHLALTFSFVWTNVIGNVITVAACFLFLKQLVKVTYIRGSLLIPFILLLIYMGAFAEKNTFEDLILVLIFGAIGWVLQQLNWPRPPLILGLVLGPLAENRLFLSTDNYGLGWLLRPGVLLLIAVTLAGAFYPLIRARREQYKKGMKDPSTSKVQDGNGTKLRRWNGSAIFSLFMIVVFIFALWESRRFDFRAGLFPWVTGFTVLALAIVQFLMDFTGKGRVTSRSNKPEAGPELPSPVNYRRTAGIWAWILGYFVAIWLFGFYIGVPLCTFLELKIAGRERWLLTLILTAFAWIIIQGLFGYVLNIPFPVGLLFSRL